MIRLRPLLSFVVVAFALLASAKLFGTTFAPRNYTCPLCGNSFEGWDAGSTSMAGGDTDLMPLSLGEPAFLAGAVTCPKCLYSGFPSDFGSHVKLTDKQKEAIKRSLKPVLPITSEIPPAVSFDLAAQTFAILGRSDFDIGNALLHASWCEKEGSLPNLGLSRERHERLNELESKIYWELPWLDRDQMSVREFDVARAGQYQKAAATKTGDARLGCLRAAASSFWRYGETERVQSLLPQFKEVLDKAAYESFALQVEQAIARERSFQQRAAEHFARAAAVAATQPVTRPTAGSDGGEETGPPSAGLLYYLAGELERRAGNPQKASALFAQAHDVDRPKWVDELLKSQEKLLPTNQPARGLP